MSAWLFDKKVKGLLHLVCTAANQGKPVSWITVKGNHIPVFDNQSKEEAVKAFIYRKEHLKLRKKERAQSRKDKAAKPEDTKPKVDKPKEDKPAKPKEDKPVKDNSIDDDGGRINVTVDRQVVSPPEVETITRMWNSIPLKFKKDVKNLRFGKMPNGRKSTGVFMVESKTIVVNPKNYSDFSAENVKITMYHELAHSVVLGRSVLDGGATMQRFATYPPADEYAQTYETAMNKLEKKLQKLKTERIRTKDMDRTGAEIDLTNDAIAARQMYGLENQAAYATAVLTKDREYGWDTYPENVAIIKGGERA